MFCGITAVGGLLVCEGRRRIACKLDRILVNHEILTLFSEARVITRTNGLSDHVPVIIQLNHSVQHSHKP